MKTSVYCTQTNYGTHSFFLVEDGNEYFLFNQKYQSSAQRYFGKRISLDAALDFSKTHRDPSLAKIMDKLPGYIRYIEKEYNIAVLKQTKKKLSKTHAACTLQAA